MAAFSCVSAKAYEELMDLVEDLAFRPESLREWRTLSAGIREQFKKKLAERLIEPRSPASTLLGFRHRYKIKLLAAVSVWSGVPLACAWRPHPSAPAARGLG